jgi:hypothetical protein
VGRPKEQYLCAIAISLVLAHPNIIAASAVILLKLMDAHKFVLAGRGTVSVIVINAVDLVIAKSRGG